MNPNILTFLSFFICLAYFLSCSNVQESKLNISEDFYIESKELKITDPGFLSSFNRPKLKEYTNAKGESVLYFFDTMLRSIIWIDDDKKQAYKKIKIEKEGPNGIPMAMEAYIISDDEIAVVEGARVYIIDYEGNVLRKLSSELPDEFEKTFFSFKGANKPLDVDSDNLYIVNVPKQENGINFMSGFPLVSVLKLESLELNMTNIMLPEKYVFDDAYYDMTNLPYVTPRNDKLYLAFRVDKNLFEYDISNGKLREIELQSIYADPIAKPSPKENYDNTRTRFKNLYTTQTFLYPVFTEKYIYRPHSRAKNPEISPAHDMYLSVYDYEFNLLKEVKLQGFGMLNFPFKYKESIAFLDGNMSTEGELTVYTFQLEETND